MGSIIQASMSSLDDSLNQPDELRMDLQQGTARSDYLYYSPYPLSNFTEEYDTGRHDAYLPLSPSIPSEEVVSYSPDSTLAHQTPSPPVQSNFEQNPGPSDTYPAGIHSLRNPRDFSTSPPCNCGDALCRSSPDYMKGSITPVAQTTRHPWVDYHRSYSRGIASHRTSPYPVYSSEYSPATEHYLSSELVPFGTQPPPYSHSVVSPLPWGYSSDVPSHYKCLTPGTPQTRDRPYRCETCNSGFSRNHDLKRHQRIHLAVKPFPCGWCEKEFSRKDALKRHLRVKICSGSKDVSVEESIRKAEDRKSVEILLEINNLKPVQ